MSQVAELSSAKRQLLAKYLSAERCSGSLAPVVRRRPPDEPARLSLAQERMWRHARQHPELTCYNEPITIHRRGSIDVSVLERAFLELLVRHESWRTTFRTIGDEPVQIIQSPAPVKILVNDVRHLPEASREAEALRLATLDAGIPFDLERGPLFRPRVVRIAESEYRLFVTVHHLILDGVTVFDIFFSELATIYDALAGGKKPCLPDLPVQYADFAYLQRQQLTADAIAEEIEHWRKQFPEEPPTLPLPTDYPHPKGQTFRGSIWSFVFPERLTDDLRTLNRQQGVTLFVALLAAFVALLHRYTGQLQIVIGTIAPGGRKSSDVQRVMGLFQNRVPLVVAVAGDPCLRELLVRVRSVVSEALCHDDVPFEIVADALQEEDKSDAGRSRFYQTIFSLVPPLPRVGPGWDITTMDFDPGGARVDLNFEMDDRPSGLLGSVQFNRDLFTETTIARIVRDFQMTVETFVANPEQRLSSLGSLKLIEDPSTTI
jgi:hypothetical protein